MKEHEYLSETEQYKKILNNEEIRSGKHTGITKLSICVSITQPLFTESILIEFCAN